MSPTTSTIRSECRTVPRRTLDAYLTRLGLDAEAPSADAVGRIHRAHVEQVPYETFWLHLGEGWSIDPTDSLGRIASGHRGGYCFHLNGALALLLTELGYTVTLHVGSVHDANGPTAETLGNHVALLVHGLPTDANPEGCWYLDAGLGDALHSPLALVDGEHHDATMSFGLRSLGDGSEWRLIHDPSGSFAAMTFATKATALNMFEGRHQFSATSPTSPFARTVTAQRRHPHGVDVARGCVLTRTRRGETAEGSSSETVDTRDDWLAMLTDEFGLRFDVSTQRLDNLWQRVRNAHETWLNQAHSEPVDVQFDPQFDSQLASELDLYRSTTCAR